MVHASRRAGLPVLALLALTACSGTGSPGTTATVASGDPATCPGEVLDVVVSVGAWGDVVRRLGGVCATVTTVATHPDDEPSDDDDLAAFDRADLVVLNGARYDRWATEAAGRAAGSPVVLDAADVAGVRRPADPHLWYDPAVVPEVATAVARELARLSPDAGPYFDAQHTTWTAELQPYLAAVATLREVAAGRRVAATEPVFDRMAAAVGLTDATPPGYRRSARAGTAPSEEDVADFEAALRDGTVEVLVHDGQAGVEVAERLRAAAEDADVPVVEVAEFPAVDAGFLEWQLEELGELAEALGEGG